jgi:transcription initiation factor TFIID subunit TAF12
MARNDNSRNGRSKQDETDRYRQAAEDALQQLDWTIGYLHGIRKTEISKALAQNRSFIRKRLMGQAEEPLPGQQTSET